MSDTCETCHLPACPRPVRAKGLCKRHYQQQWRTGSPDIARPNPHATPEERFWRYANRTDPTACWVWSGRTDKDGYGTLRIGTSMVRAHRFSYELHHGPTNLLVRHSCDNAPCVNPAHLQPGTHLDNMADRKAAGHYPRRIAKEAADV